MLGQVDELQKQCDDIAALVELCSAGDDADFFKELQAELESFDKKQQSLKIVTLLSGKYDGCNAIMNMQAPAEQRRRTGRKCC